MYAPLAGQRRAQEGAYMRMRRKKEEHNDEIKKNMRPIRCPECGGRMMDAGIDTNVQFYTPAKDRYPDFIIKCRHCGAEIGVMKTE